MTLNFTLQSNIQWPTTYIVAISDKKPLYHKKFATWTNHVESFEVQAAADMKFYGVNFNYSFGEPTNAELQPFETLLGQKVIDNTAPQFRGSCKVKLDVLCK